MFKLALRNVFRQKVRTAMTLAAIIIGVVGLILSGGFVQDIFIQLGEAVIHSQSGHLQINRAGFFEQGSRSPDKYVIDDPAKVKATVAALPQVSDAMARLYFSGLLNNGRTDLSVIGEGIEPDLEATLGTYIMITAGRRLTDQDEHGIMIGHGAATAAKLKPGDQVTLVVNTSEGALNTLDFEIVGIFQTYSKEFDARAVRIPLAAARLLLNTKGANSVVVGLKETADTDAVRAALLSQFSGAKLEIKAWYELNDFYEKTVDLYKRQFGVLRLIVLFMVLLSVANSVNMSAFERVAEFGTMMALGNTTGHVFRLIVTENIIVGFLGGALGVVLGIVLAVVISAIGIPMPPPPNANLGYTAFIRIVPEEIGMAFAVGLVATVVASILPARRVVKIPVVEALRQAI